MRGWLSPAEPGCQQRLLAASIPTYTVPDHIAMATDLIPLRNMRKQDMVEELERYGLASLTSTTNDIMLVVIKALREDMAVKKPPGLGKMPKKELLELCIEKGVEVDEKTVTCNEMRLLLQGVDVQGTIAEARRVVRRHQVGDASPATGSEPHSEPAGQFKSINKTDKMKFGKYHDKTYGYVLEKDMGYSQWAVLELHMGRAPPRLKRFARWAEAHGVPELPEEKLQLSMEEATGAQCIIDDSVKAAVARAKESGVMKMAADAMSTESEINYNIYSESETGWPA